MGKFIHKIEVSNGIYWVEMPEIDLNILCGCPADSVKHLMKRGLIQTLEEKGLKYETGPNAILLSDVMIQKGMFSNMAEFPILQMFYRQGMIIPGHPNNTGAKPLLIGSKEQLDAQINYIYRGNYGLVSIEELIESGLSRDQATEMMRLKLKFAFGKITDPKNMFDIIYLESDKIHIRQDLYIKRKKINVFEFSYKDESVTVDLNIDKPYNSPYKLGFYNTKRDYFSIIHSGQGDGWDIYDPCMASIVMFQGKIYLIDAGPNIQYSLTALGIGINEIEGLFHTHAHDDHFAGITSIMMSDHKIKYYATSTVRHSVMKKLSALLNIEEDSFYNFFDVQDLKPDIWNQINGLDVKPIFSPHPVETTIFIFRAISKEGYRTYGHFADIVGLNTLYNMVSEDISSHGISLDNFKIVKERYSTPLTLKKIDIGGGMIHGEVKDFTDDESDKIVLAHTSVKLTDEQKAVGSEAEFGAIDVLIESKQNYTQRYAFGMLKNYFQKVPIDQIHLLLNNNTSTFNPGTIIIKDNQSPDNVYLILTGIVECISRKGVDSHLLSEGTLVGEINCINGTVFNKTYRALSYVRILEIPSNIFLYFVSKNGLYEEIEKIKDKIEFLQNTWLFGEKISYPVQNRIASKMELKIFPSGTCLPHGTLNKFYLIKYGKISCKIGDEILETLEKWDYFGEENALYGTPDLFNFEVEEEVGAYELDGEILGEIPNVRWKLLEKLERKKKKIDRINMNKKSPFFWRPEYNIKIKEIDADHKKIFDLAENIYVSIRKKNSKDILEREIEYLINFSEEQFRNEEELLKKYEYPEYKDHCKKHGILMKKLRNIQSDVDVYEYSDEDLVKLLRDWILNHIFEEDRRYAKFLNSLDVY